MSDTTRQRGWDKLPRHSYYYIKVGHRFYGGEVTDTTPVMASNRPVRVTYYQKNGQRMRETQTWGDSGSFRGPAGFGARRTRAARDIRKGTLAQYAKSSPRIKETLIQISTGAHTPVLVDSLPEAKKFRSRRQVESACARVQSMYGDLDAKISVQCVQGEIK